MRFSSLLRFAALGIGAGALGLAALTGAAAAPVTYTANLTPTPLNGANSATGRLTLVLDGNQATITEQVSGLAATFMNAPYPHVQHIHGGAAGTCPTASADTNKDGVLSTNEGQPSYGDIQTTLSLTGDTTPAAGTNIQTAPSGASFTYSRTITLDAPTLASINAGKAVIVVHGLDPATAAPAATSSPSELVPSLPLAATSPALCGVLTAGAAAPAAAAPAPSTAGGQMRPPAAGDAGLLDRNSGSANWTFYGAAFVMALGLVGGGSVVALRNRSR